MFPVSKLIAACVFFCSLSLFAGAFRPPLELELSPWRYRTLLEERGERARNDALAPVISAGSRLLDWITFVNQSRPETNRLSLSSPRTQQGFPITAPKLSNQEIVLDDFETWKRTAPGWFKDIVLNGRPFLSSFPVTDSDFIIVGLRLDRVYEAAARWILEEPYLQSYVQMRRYDVRGYYYLTQEPELSRELTGFDSLPGQKQKQLKKWLVGLCYNALVSDETCEYEFQQSRGSLNLFFEKYVADGKAAWDTFFDLGAIRDDVAWRGNRMSVPFRDPHRSDLESFLKDNIQDEWRWKNWALLLNFTPSAEAHLAFAPGTTPHVNGLGGNTITMDANAPLTEYDVQWTIRHEFGHVLGFPDCYLEFYDETRRVMVDYQLDTTNLMCSRKGHIKQLHYDALKKAYGN